MSKSRRKKSPKRVLALPDLEQVKSAVLNSLSSASGQRTYDHAIDEFRGLVLLRATPSRDADAVWQSYSIGRCPHRCPGLTSGRAPRHAVRRTPELSPD